MSAPSRRPGWLSTLRRYVFLSAIMHLVWETAQLPLYTIWATATRQALAYAVLHCTAGDLMIAVLSLLAAIIALGAQDWPASKFRQVFVLTLVLGIAYTIQKPA